MSVSYPSSMKLGHYREKYPSSHSCSNRHRLHNHLFCHTFHLNTTAEAPTTTTTNSLSPSTAHASILAISIPAAAGCTWPLRPVMLAAFVANSELHHHQNSGSCIYGLGIISNTTEILVPLKVVPHKLAEYN